MFNLDNYTKEEIEKMKEEEQAAFDERTWMRDLREHMRYEMTKPGEWTKMKPCTIPEEDLKWKC